MIDFWMPETKFDVPKLDLTRHDRMLIGEVDTWTIWSGIKGLGVTADVVICRQVRWHKDFWVPDSSSYILILETYGQKVQCRDRRPDAIDQSAGMIVGVDLHKTHRLLAPSGAKTWCGLSVSAQEPMERSRVEALMTDAIADLKASRSGILKQPHP